MANKISEGDNYTWGFFYRDQNGKFIRPWYTDLTSQLKLFFKLPPGTPLQPPKVIPLSTEEKLNLHSKYLINKHNTIVLCPHSTTTQKLSETFWENFVARLDNILPPDKHRICVYTNIKDSSEYVIKGTLPICATVKEMFYVAENSLCVIGMRSGLIEFLSLSKATTLIFGQSAFEDDLKSVIFDTRIMFPFSNLAHTIYFDTGILDFIKNFASGIIKSKSRLELLKRVMNDDRAKFFHTHEEAIEFVTEFVKKKYLEEESN